MKKSIILMMLIVMSTLWAAETEVPEAPKADSVNREQGLISWQRIYEVASHPRCANCHVGDSPYPMWSGPSYGSARRHGMNINAGVSRIGAESLLCSTCHTNSNSDEAHGAPGVQSPWRLAPIEAAWFGKNSSEICHQLRDPQRNGNRTFEDIATHLGHDVILHWAWRPGGDREPAPYSLSEHVADILTWGEAGMPCPGDDRTETVNEQELPNET